MFGVSFDKLLVLAGIAIVLLGPTRLPVYAEKLGQLVRNLRGYVDSARDRMREEMGPEFEDIDWKKLDPRQYDPRRIIRDALLDDSGESILSAPRSSATDSGDQVIGLASVATAGAASLAAAPAALAAPVAPKPARLVAGELPPFDSEAT